jgi:hypothetical protein
MSAKKVHRNLLLKPPSFCSTRFSQLAEASVMRVVDFGHATFCRWGQEFHRPKFIAYL